MLGLGSSNESICLEVGVIRAILGTVKPQGTTGLKKTSPSIFIQALVCLQGLCPGPIRALLFLHCPHHCFLGLRLTEDKGMRNKGCFPLYSFFKVEVVGHQKTLLNLSCLLSDELCVGAETFC